MGELRFAAAVAVAALASVLPIPEAAADPAADRMQADVAALSGAAPREAGTAREAAAFDFISNRLAQLGVAVGGEDVPLPNGRTSRNRWTSFGTGPVEILLGGHVDTLAVSPGADDNGSGVAVLLELARRLDDGSVRVPPGTTVTLVWFGAEERLAGRVANDHHYGSRQLAAERLAAGQPP
ncbi:MAG: M28 family peptidase, partial [Acidimicrobiia bacterium]|nr:M28 family peptidase [Acidimicrobiia bacterium]